MRMSLKNLPKVIAAGMLIASIFTRPSLLGEVTTIVGSLGFFLCGLATLELCGISRLLLERTMLSQGSAIILWLFLMFHSLFNGVPGTYMMTAFLTISLSSVGACLAFSNRAVHDAFFSAFRVYLALNALSFIITVLLTIVLSLPSIYLTTISIGRYALSEYGDVYLPFTISYGYREYFGITVPRLGAGFRESGIAQAFYACSIISIPHLRSLKQYLVFALLLVGGLATQSTTGMALVGIAFCVRIMRLEGLGKLSRIGLIVVMTILGFFAIDFAINDETVGFAAKEDTESYFDRRDQTEAGLKDFFKNPMGVGVYSPDAPGGINLLSSLNTIGIIGIIFVVVNIISTWIGSFDRTTKAFYILPIFLTALTSQPLLDAPLVYVVYGFLAFPSVRRSSRASNQPQSRLFSGRGVLRET